MQSIVRTTVRDDSEGVFHRVASEDVEPVLERNRASQNDGTNGFFASRDFRHIATIPAIFVEKFLVEDGLNILHNPDHLDYLIRRKLADPDFRWLKSVDGRI